MVSASLLEVPCLRKVPYNILRFVLCSKADLGNGNPPPPENDLTEDQKEHMETIAWGWRGCLCSLYLGSGLLVLRQCLANSPWLSLGIGAAEAQAGEGGGGY